MNPAIHHGRSLSAWACCAAALMLVSPCSRAAPALVPAPCPDGVDPQAATCGTLLVPERYGSPQGRQIELFVVVVPPAREHGDQVPLVQLAGGPGNSIADTATWYLDEGGASYAFRRDRPVILLDQRGTGRSNALRCPELETRGPFDPFYPLDRIRRCRDELSADNDLRQFSTLHAARDIDRVRSALGHQRIDLWAISYGTILAQVYLRKFPGRVRSAVLVGTAPIDSRFPLHHAAHAQRVLDLIFAQCRSDDACTAAHPNARDRWMGLLHDIERNAAAFSSGGAGQMEVPGAIPRGPFAEAFRGLLSSTASQRRVPHLVYEASRGRLSELLDALAVPGDASFATGLYLSVTCAESTSRIRPTDIDQAVAATFLGAYRVREQRAACEQWPMARPPESFFRPVSSDVPVLLLVGELDYVTPPAWSYEVARGLTRSRIVTMPYAGHLFWDWGPPDHPGGLCFDALALDFYARGNADDLDTSCVNAVPPPFDRHALAR